MDTKMVGSFLKELRKENNMTQEQLGKIVDMDVVPDTGAAQFPGDGLKDVFGVISEEIDTFYPTDRNQVTLWDGSKAQVRDYAELLRV